MATSDFDDSLDLAPDDLARFDEVVLRHLVSALHYRGLESLDTAVRLRAGFAIHIAPNVVVWSTDAG